MYIKQPQCHIKIYTTAHVIRTVYVFLTRNPKRFPLIERMMSWKQHVYPTHQIFLLHIDSNALQSFRETTVGSLQHVQSLVQMLMMAHVIMPSQVSLKSENDSGMYVLIPDAMGTVTARVCVAGTMYHVHTEATADTFSLMLNDVYFMAKKNEVGPFEQDVHRSSNGMFMLYDRTVMNGLTHTAIGSMQAALETIRAQNKKMTQERDTKMSVKWEQGKEHIKGLEVRLLKVEQERDAAQQRANDLATQKSEWKHGRNTLKTLEQQFTEAKTENTVLAATCTHQQAELNKAQKRLDAMSDTIQLHVDNASILQAKFQDVIAMNRENVLRKKQQTEGEKYFDAFHPLALRVKDPSKLKQLGRDLLMLFEALQQSSTENPFEILTTAEALLSYIKEKNTTLGPLAYVKQLEKKLANVTRVNRLLMDKMKSKV